MNTSILDYKGWIQNKADDIAREEYDQEFYDLPEEIRDAVYNKATQAYKDTYADLIFARYSQRFQGGEVI